MYVCDYVQAWPIATNELSGGVGPWRYDRTNAELDRQYPTMRILLKDIFVQKAFQHENYSQVMESWVNSGLSLSN